MKKISLIVPVLNEENNIIPFFKKIKEYTSAPNYEFEILFVNGSSNDKTLNIIKELSEKEKSVKYISLSKNFGKEGSILAGLKTCQKSDACICIDVDLQENPKYIQEMLSYYEKGYKVVYTKQKKRNHESKIKKFLADMYYKIFNLLSDTKIENGIRDFQLLDRQVVEEIIKIGDRDRFSKGLFAWVGFSRIGIEIELEKRQVGQSKFNFFKLFLYGLKGLSQFSDLFIFVPLIFMVIFIIMLFTSFLIYVFGALNGNTFIIYLFFEFIGFVFSSLSFVNLHLLYQIKKQVLERPVYIIEESNYDNVTS